ncbi:MAG: HAMP domain-containing histidine kinase [SAR324 cluster bacterium]|uniref:histidine kinase n=1 Tax=SAR324 cluster bacterium TaxID=2024889 RepID=A0A7X9IK90_9DELT|nr:HAMP domain-containing histidine kinase [SAR324 cluster bacterium]
MKNLRSSIDTGMLLRYVLVGLWALLTIALSGWWAYFAACQAEALAKLDNEYAKMLARHQNMLLWEGVTLFLCLIGGSFALAWAMYKERREIRRTKRFFAAFTHELKTPLAALRLQAEILKERINDSFLQEKLVRLLSDLERLYLRLENSLFLSAANNLTLVSEELNLEELILSLQDVWASVKIKLSRCSKLYADRKALEVIIGNLIENSITHGKASSLFIDVEEKDSGMVELSFKDNGKGFDGDPKRLAELFFRQNSSSGSGVGLYVVKLLVQRMKGTISFLEKEKGFEVKLQLPGRLL